MTQIIETLHEFIAQKDLKNDSISNWSVGSQIEHCTKVIYGVCHALKNSDPSTYKYKFNFSRNVILLFGYIPKGKAKAPKATTPNEAANKEDLKNYLQKAETMLKEIDGLDKNAYFDHPYFGMVNLKLAKRFLEVHTNHHIKIIKSIVNTAS